MISNHRSAAEALGILLDNLEALGLTPKRPKDMAAVRDALAIYSALGERHDLAYKLTAAPIDSTNLITRLAEGKDILDSEIIEHATRQTAFKSSIESAAKSLFFDAQRASARGARAMIQPLLPDLVADLRQALSEAGEEPGQRTLRAIKSALKCIDLLAGRDVCDYWLIADFSTGKWDVLQREQAEARQRANDAFEKKAKEQALEEPRPVRVDNRPTRRLQRDTRRGGTGFNAPEITNADLNAWKASDGREALVR